MSGFELPILSISVLVTATLCAFPVASASLPIRNSECPTAFWNFGDSLTDTGSILNAFPQCSQCDAERKPYGESFFGRPAMRFSNGRVVPDFFALAFQKPLLQSYMQAGAFDYRFGANFATAGAAASNETARSPIFLPLQISQFVRLKQRAAMTRALKPCGRYLPSLPLEDSYSKGLYTIGIGGVDVVVAFSKNNQTPDYFTTHVIPEAMANIAKGIETLYESGARQFLFFNLHCAGCSTKVVSLLSSVLSSDNLGSNIPKILMIQAFNSALKETVASARLRYPAAIISVFDYFAANMEILLNPAKYGFNPNLTQTTCCGVPGLPADIDLTCGISGSTTCSNPEEYVIWDGAHYTEAFYRVISKFVLNGQFTDTSINYTANCNLKFDQFGPEATFEGVYPETCEVIFT
ncbi:hypothetical protein R1flu_015752 [Riccia fluitans]|uniref:Uncharacterized protein n=1 Tax=Riccia fluitans TaxID=41844 RepID=A0ABD1YJU9_9MARC